MTGHEFELREQDRWLPIANVARLMKNTLPTTAKVSKDAKECMQECVSEFISFVTSEASDRCLMEKRKTINGEDVLYSLHTLGFENYAEVLKIYLAKYRQQQALRQERGEIRQKKKKKKNDDNLNYDNQLTIKQEEDSNEIFEFPMDESMTVIRGNVNEIEGNSEAQNSIEKNQISDNSNNNNNNNNSKLNENKINPTFNDPYVSQLYEQEYAGVPLHISNPDYKSSASESISMKRSHMKLDNKSNGDINNNNNNTTISNNNNDLINSTNINNKENNNDNNIGHNDVLLDGNLNKSNDNIISNNDNMDDNVEIPLDTDSIGLSLNVDNTVGVGVNVHLGNTESLDEINSRLNRDVNEHVIDGNNLIDHDLNSDNGIGIDEKSDNEISGSNLHNQDNNHNHNHQRIKTDVTKTPATTSTSDLLLLNDNIAGVSESEEIVGLSNGHSGMYRFE